MPMIQETMLKRLLLQKLAAGGGGAAPVERTATGNPLVFTTDLAKPLKSLLIPFTPQQEGTGDPSPQNIRSILPWNGLKVWNGGKNILALTANSPIKNIDTGADTTIKRTNLEIGAIYEGVTQNNYWRGETASRYIVNRANGGLTFITNDGAYGFGVCVPLNPNTKYTLSYTGNGVAMRIAQYAKDGTHVNGQNFGSTNPKTFTSASDVAYALIILTCDSNNTNQEVTISNVLLEVGETASAYEEYKPITETDISFPSPVYGGTLDVVSGVLTVEYIVHTFTANDALNQYGTYTGGIRINTTVLDNTKVGGSSAICNIATKLNSVPETIDTLAYRISGGTSRTAIFVPDSMFDGSATVDKFKEWLSENEFTICAELETPQEITLTPEQITALKGDNTIWSDANGEMTATYLKKAE